MATERGFEVLSCRPVEAEGKLALASLSDLLAPLVDTLLADLPEPQRQSLEVALLRKAPGDVFPDGRVVATAVHSLLRRRATDVPILIAIDDVQWLDRSSAAALSFAVRRLANSTVGSRSPCAFSRGRRPIRSICSAISRIASSACGWAH